MYVEQVQTVFARDGQGLLLVTLKVVMLGLGGDNARFVEYFS